MKAYIKKLKKLDKKVHFASLFAGMAIGFGVGVFALNAILPENHEMIRVYKLEQKNGDVLMHRSHNPYMMGDVTSEKQFVQDMIKHHEAAVTMAQQVLAFDLREEVRQLAEDIISGQSTEIQMMKQWLKEW